MDNQSLQNIDFELTSSPPITRLNGDVLWHIFTLNASECGVDVNDPETDVKSDEGLAPNLHPLTIARYTSQVCRQWRNLVIGSSSIWARLIDLDYINEKETDYWMDEIMKRTGNSLLSVIGGKGYGPHSPEVGCFLASRRFFLSLLTDHWSRIRKFDVIVYPFEFEDSLWDIFWDRPAPCLEEFSLQPLFDWEPFPEKLRVIPFFSDHAPLLRAFHCTKIGFNYRASWISQLSSLTLSDPLTLQEALDVLSHTYCLETLALSTVHNKIPLHPRQLPINLPHLHQIRVADMVKTCLAFLKYINPAAKCQLRLVFLDTPEAFFELSDLQISRFLEGSCKFSPENARACVLRMSSCWFTFTVPGGNRDVDQPRTLTIETSTPFAFPLNCLFPISYLSSISQVEFIHRTGLDSRRNDSYYEDHIRDMFISSLISVKTIRISHAAFEPIRNLLPQGILVFPALNTLQLRYSREVLYDLKDQGPLISFLAHRICAGAPIAVLDLSEWWAMKPGINWEFLEVLEGLKVVWNPGGAGEYICGSGWPGKLDFR